MLIEKLSNAIPTITSRKKDLCEKSGVSGYWIVSLDTKETVGFFLKNGKYGESGRYIGKVHSIVLASTEFEF